MAEARPTLSFRVGTTTEIEQLWQQLADDPQQQALLCVDLCLRAAPHLIEWLEQKIYRGLPDALLKQLVFGSPSDGRIQAINRLAEFKQNKFSKPAAPVAKRTTQRRVASTPRIAIKQLTPEESYQLIFQVTPVVQPKLEPLRVDWELGRLAIKLKSAALFRAWSIGRDLTSREQGSGKIEIANLWQRMKAYGITYTKRHFNRLIQAGNGKFWRVVGEMLYLSGYRTIARLFSLNSGEYEGDNLPGVRAVYLDPSGCLERWESMLFAGWLAGRGYKEDVTLSREMQTKLFGRTANTLRKWEKDRLEGIVSKRRNFAQCPETDRYLNHIPLHAQPYVAKSHFRGQIVEEVRLRWQLPNTYHSEIKSHPHRGQASKVRRSVTKAYPTEIKRGGFYLRYLASPEILKKRYKSLKFRMGKYGDTTKPVLVFIGTHRRSKTGIFEITNSGFVLTQANERLEPRAEGVYRDTHPPVWVEGSLAYWSQEADQKTAKLGHFLRAQ